MKRIVLTACVVLGIAFALLAPAAVLFVQPAPGAGLPACECGAFCSCPSCDCGSK